MLTLLLLLALNVVTERKFISGNSRYTGQWEYGECAELVNDELMIITNTSKGKGSVWFSQRMSSKTWKVNISFKMLKESISSQLGIWFTKDYGAFGPSFGGPLLFQGFGILCYWNGSLLQVELRQNDGKGQYTSYSFFPTFECSPKDSSFTIFCDYLSGNFSVMLSFDDNISNIFNERLLVRVRKPWFAITAQNTKIGFPVVINRIEIEGLKQHMEISKVMRESLRKLPLLNKTIKLGKEIAAIEVIECLEEMIQHSENLVNKRDAVDQMQTSLLPYVERWQRRSFGIMNRTTELRFRLANGLEEAEHSVAVLRDDVDRLFAKLKMEVQDVESDLYYGILRGYTLDHEIRKAKKIIKKGGLSKILVITSIGEIIILCAYFRLKQTDSDRHNM